MIRLFLANTTLSSFAHPTAGSDGRDNAFHVQVGSDLADLYSDTRPLQGQAAAITLAAARRHNAFGALLEGPAADPLEVRRARRVVVWRSVIK